MKAVENLIRYGQTTERNSGIRIFKAVVPALYSTQNEEKSCVVEIFNRTLKSVMHKYFTANNTRIYIDVLNELVNHYNNSRHSSTKMTAVEVVDMPHLAYLDLYDDIIHDTSESPAPKFHEGDRVRISKKKHTFEKGFIPKWTEELFTISAIQNTRPITYKINYLNNQPITGTLYEPELQKSTQDTFRSDRIIRVKGSMLVKWKGYSDEFNSWIDKSSIISLK